MFDVGVNRKVADLAGVPASTEDGGKNVFNELRIVPIDHNHTFVLYVSCQSRENFEFWGAGPDFDGRFCF